MEVIVDIDKSNFFSGIVKGEMFIRQVQNRLKS